MVPSYVNQPYTIPVRVMFNRLATAASNHRRFPALAITLLVLSRSQLHEGAVDSMLGAIPLHVIHFVVGGMGGLDM